ncbi:NAD(P)H-dependent oxidoreductase [Vibrio fluvialis]|uniref:NAD(P)H-dependent oxidoreductase n=1 Tax=Vibrio fluvialis TaxID=676 RepID=UPI0011811B81|nr:NAD(P)H-dependent oxidoreductase [Vibrio fluvialis]EKO3560449.1 NAD(P)H-dependent oxidoreductase [Vibrio fluvialis]MBL4248618.1 NAD(P)H-dependent oxidoreductase [Vibrio fluvialis]MBL4257564.1 NAD(P)H-dependent oxidoreductase [Vibrio fluvialis]MBY8019783.1 NAD(P)H-dependent oxidoreductase [Vibrio fluvialis]MBY8276658.1 NAD(P)H-dependent oxidoreductase [Vibrio fluvialis]
MTSQRILILYAHPCQHKSEVNARLFKAARYARNVTLVDLYGEYPTFNIDVDKEQQRLLDHDVIIFQFPMYWYSTPSILKEWQDLVLEYGFAYGQDGTALHGKTLLCITSTGGKSESYQASGYNHYSVRELLRPIEQMAGMTGMQYLAPLVLFDARAACDDERLNAHIKRYMQVLQALGDDCIDIERAGELPTLNQYFRPMELRHSA